MSVPVVGSCIFSVLCFGNFGSRRAHFRLAIAPSPVVRVGSDSGGDNIDNNGGDDDDDSDEPSVDSDATTLHASHASCSSGF
jgi:hypothetical protein